jgi:hypothetical protein
MTKKLINFSLYIRSTSLVNGIDFTVSPTVLFELQDGLYIYKWEYDPRQVFEVKVVLNNTNNNQSHILIEKVTAGSFDITTDCLTYGIYKRFDTNTVERDTYGYMSWPGEYRLKVRTNPMSHKWLMNFFKKSTQIPAQYPG